MKKYYMLGENIFFEIDENNNCFLFFFGENKNGGFLKTENKISENYLKLAEETNKWNYQKELEIRIKYFSKTFS